MSYIVKFCVIPPSNDFLPDCHTCLKLMQKTFTPIKVVQPVKKKRF